MQEEDTSTEKLYENLYGQEDNNIRQMEETRLSEYNKTLKYKILTHNYDKNTPNYGEAQFEVINNSLNLYSCHRK